LGFIHALTSAPGLRQFTSAVSYRLPDDHRDYEPELDLPWNEAEMEADPAEIEIARADLPGEMFLVCRQTGITTRGEPIFGDAFASDDESLALSEDGYLINGEGQFLLGMPLDEKGRATGNEPMIVRLDASAIETQATGRIAYRANLPSYPMTAAADFDVAGSELLDKTLFARDPSVQGSGIVLGDERLKFLDRSLAGGSVTITSPEGHSIQLVLRWAKATSLRSAGRDSWNLFYRVRRDPRPGEVAWKNVGHHFIFGHDGRLEEASLAIPVMDMMVDGVRLGNLSIVFGPGGITQFADRGGLVKVLKSEADGYMGGEFAGISLSSRGRLFAHYTNDTMRPVAEIHFTGEEPWFGRPEAEWRETDDRLIA
jgi:flagellar hook protein FlgE